MKNLPNYLSIFRICLVPIFTFAYFSDPRDIKIYAALVYALASFTDFLDGHLARKMNTISLAGKVLDPLGDKLMTLAVLVCITIDGVISVWVVAVFLLKESMMGIGGLIIMKKARVEIPPSNYIGKVSTVVFFVACVVLMLFRNIPANIAMVLMSVAVGIMLIALGSYIITFSGIMKNYRKETGNNQI
jgi:cardiolipin synthase